MLKTVTSINGRILPKSKATVSVFDNALLYAEGLFETLLAVDDRLIFADEHLARLKHGAEVTGLGVPAPSSKLLRWMTAALKLHSAHVKKLRLTVTSGESARWTGRQGKQQVIISVSPHELPKRPYRLLVSPFRVDHRSEFRNIKTLSYAIHAAAIRQAKTARCDDALLLNERNDVAEVTSANVFWVKNRRLFTPPLSAGCLEGVTRAMVMKEATKFGLPVVERRESLAGILKADEIFISSSLKLIAGVSVIVDGDRRHRIAAGPVTRQLSRHFLKLVSLA